MKKNIKGGTLFISEKQVMFQLSTQKELTCVASGSGKMFAKKGAMVAYKGQFRFQKVLIDPNGGLSVGGVARHLARRLTGENMELMEVSGQGDCYFADEAQHVTVIDLNPGETIGVESENLLAFTENCSYGIRPIGVGVISQKGLFTSTLKATGAGAQVAVKSDGNPIILETPCVVDPDAVVCWTGPDPQFKVDVNWKTLIGQTSGESYMLNFTQPGSVVIIQPSERLSGLKLAIDDKRYTPETQNNAAQSSMQNMRDLGQQIGSALGGNGTPGNGNLGNIIGNIFR